MGLRFASEKCSGCGACVEICPGDLLYLNGESKSAMRNEADCWDCMSCVKVCPARALETKLPFSLADYGASLRPEMANKTIKWVCTYPDGREEEFMLPRS